MKHSLTFLLSLAVTIVAVTAVTYPNPAEAAPGDCLKGPRTGPFFADCTIEDLTPECAAGGSCTAVDEVVKRQMYLKCSTDSGAGGCSEQETSLGKAQMTADQSSCSALDPGHFFYNCVWLPLMSWLGSLFLSIGAYVLMIAGIVFNILIEHVVIGFRTTLDFLSITPAIDLGWGIFRDLANIFIIGIFTFIAISIILGLKTYGQKKLIAKVLIIAVLINFSLLFTKIIIDASNYSAYVVYKQMSAGGDSLDISQGFLVAMGITDSQNGVWDTKKLTDKVANDPSGGGFAAFIYGLIGGLVLLATALVLLYGCFLILARGILFLFLMLTSAFAFATYLLPSLQKTSYGWDEWWKSLLNAAIFAPLLMVFLAASLSIVTAANGLERDSFGNILSDPRTLASGSGWVTIVTYMVGLGLLFISFRFASGFASRIPHFNLGAALPAFGLGIAGRVTGAVGRQFIGRPAMNLSERLQQRAKNSDSILAKRLYDFGAQQFKKPAQSDFNLMRGAFGKAVQGAAGIKKLDDLAGKKIGGFEGSQKAYLKRVAQSARRTELQLTKEERERIEREGLDAVLRKDPDLAQRYAEAEKSHNEAGDLEKVLSREHETTQRDFARIESRLVSSVNGRRAELAGTAEGTGEHAEATRRLSEAESALAEERRRQSNELGLQTMRIREAREATQRASDSFRDVKKDLHDVGVARRAIPRQADEIARDMVRGDFTAALFRQSRFFGRKGVENLAKGAAKETGKQRRQHEAEENLGPALREFLKEERHEAEEHPPAAGGRAGGGGPTEAAHEEGGDHGGGGGH